MYPSGRYVVVEVTIETSAGAIKQTAYKVIVQDKEVVSI